MKKVTTWIAVCFLTFNGLFAQDLPTSKTIVIGSGIIGALECYNVYSDSVKNGTTVQIVVYEKGPSFEEGASTNAAYHICPSLTPDEILSVVPRGSELIDKLALLFSEPGGIRVDDVPQVNDSPSATRFKEAVELYGQDPNHDDRTQHLLKLGKMSMDLWQNIYDEADVELKGILEKSNFNPCRECQNSEQALHDGYRIDLIYEVANAQARAEGMRDTYMQLGYSQCKLLSPAEVMEIDPALTQFCMAHSELNTAGECIWKKDSASIWRPGGCLFAHSFLPSFYAYLKKRMGTYIDASGTVQHYFTIKFNKEVEGVELSEGGFITALKFKEGAVEQSDPATSHYVFCPGEAVGTLCRFGFEEPAYAGFAGPSLNLNIPLSSEQVETYKSFSHCMEVHKVGIVLAWQARCLENNLLLQAAGTKAFYGDQAPHINEAFAINRHLVQLNMMNDVLPEMVSIAFGRDTKGMNLSLKDLQELEQKGFLGRWVGRRAVAYDGFPTLGSLYSNGIRVKNARCTTHLGSGGVSFGPASVLVSRSCEKSDNDPFIVKILEYADSRR